MGKENPLRRAVKNTIAILLLSLPVSLPVAHHDSTTRVIKALKGKDLSCSSGESVYAGYPFDLIAVPGAGTYIDEDGSTQLSSIEKGRLRAAAHAYISGYAPSIILLHGYGDLASSLAREYLQEQVTEISEHTKALDNNSIFVDKESINTATNMKYLADFVADKELKKVLLITDKFHSQRAQILACNYGVNSQILTVEELTDQDYVCSQDDVAEMELIRQKELIEVLALAYDPYGQFPTALKAVSNFIQGNGESVKDK